MFFEIISRVRLSPLKSPILCKYINPFKRCGIYPSISKCNAKRFRCCNHWCTTSTVTSSVNGRQFSVINNTDLDWKSSDLIYLLKWNEKKCGMQYVGQLAVLIKFDLVSTIVEWKRWNFLYRHFKRTGHSPTKVSVQPVEIITYDENSTPRFKIIKRHETE